MISSTEASEIGGAILVAITLTPFHVFVVALIKCSAFEVARTIPLIAFDDRQGSGDKLAQKLSD